MFIGRDIDSANSDSVCKSETNYSDKRVKLTVSLTLHLHGKETVLLICRLEYFAKNIVSYLVHAGSIFYVKKYWGGASAPLGTK